MRGDAESLRVIDCYAFRDCESLPEIKIPASVVEIGRGDFRRCTSLTRVTIPANVREVGEDIFRGCERLEKIFYPAGSDIERQLSRGNGAELIAI